MLLWRVVRKKMSLIRNFAQSPWPVSSPPARFYPPFFSFVGGGPAVFLMPFCTGFGDLSRIRPPCRALSPALYCLVAGGCGGLWGRFLRGCCTVPHPVRASGPSSRTAVARCEGPAGRHLRHSHCFGRRCTLGTTAQRLPKNAQPFWPGTRQHPRCGR